MSDQAIIRVQREIGDLMRNPDQSFIVHQSEENILHVHAMIFGPPSTPYSHGMFDFTLDFPKDYPTNAPKVVATTTSGNRVRFNPNIYAGGKVCLSILGTWRGESGEQWSSAHGILSVLISIQSLMSDKPYHNEPGFENSKDDKNVEAYNDKIRHETLRVAICERMETILRSGEGGMMRNWCSCRPRSPFEDVAKRYYLLFHETYLESVEKEMERITDGTAFPRMQFEYASNTMEGQYNYKAIKERLLKIYKQLEDEWQIEWVKDSQKRIADDTTTKSNLKSQFEQIVESKEFEGKLDLELEDGNPFIWNITIWGPMMTPWEGGMFRARIVFNEGFPDIWPRAKFTTPLSHPHITKTGGYPFYKVRRLDDIRSHLSELYNLFAEDIDPNPGSHVNREAAELCFGSKDQRREYARNARRAAQRSTEL